MARVAAHLELARVRKEAEELMRYRTEQFETLLNQAPLGVYLVDADFRIRQVNPMAGPLFENIPNLIGRDFDEVIHRLWEKCYADEIVQIFRHTLETGKPYATAERIEQRLDRGVTEYYEWRTDRITLPDGRYGVVCYFRDISAQVKARALVDEANARLRNHTDELEKTVIERTARLSETIQELETFSYSIAHDMRAPLRSMQGFATILKEECAENITPEGNDYLRRISASADRLDQLIQDVLDYSKIIRGEFPLEVVNLRDFIAEIVESYPNLNGPRCNISLEGSFPFVLANQAALTQVISNLLGNGIKFMKPGVNPSVCVRAESQASGIVRVWFEDNGIGIRKELQERIFLMFQRLNAPGQYEGTGMGLTIVRKAVERMGGRVGVESELGQGSRFWIELKQMQQPSPPLAE
jgi:PAS domain S-box-containing protein